jgi:hypothetical protein
VASLSRIAQPGFKTLLPTDTSQVQNLFESSWNHPDKAAQIQGIYMVRPADGETGLRASGHCYPSYMGERFNEFMRHLDEQSR